MAAAPAPARVPAHLQYRVQLLFVTEEQLFGAGPLSPSTAKSLRLEVHPAGEEADATVTDGEVQGAAHARESRSEVVARVRACAGAAVGKVLAEARCAWEEVPVCDLGVRVYRCGARTLGSPEQVCIPNSSPRAPAGLPLSSRKGPD